MKRKTAVTYLQIVPDQMMSWSTQQEGKGARVVGHTAKPPTRVQPGAVVVRVELVLPGPGWPSVTVEVPAPDAVEAEVTP